MAIQTKYTCDDCGKAMSECEAQAPIPSYAVSIFRSESVADARKDLGRSYFSFNPTYFNNNTRFCQECHYAIYLEALVLLSTQITNHRKKYHKEIGEED